MCVASCEEWRLLCVRNPGWGMVDGLGGHVDEEENMKADKRLKGEWPMGGGRRQCEQCAPHWAPGPLWPARAHSWPNHRKPGAQSGERGHVGEGQRLQSTVPSAQCRGGMPQTLFPSPAPLPRRELFWGSASWGTSLAQYPSVMEICCWERPIDLVSPSYQFVAAPKTTTIT